MNVSDYIIPIPPTWNHSKPTSKHMSVDTTNRRYALDQAIKSNLPFNKVEDLIKAAEAINTYLSHEQY